MNEDAQRALRRWQELDRRLMLGEFDAATLAHAAIEANLARRVLDPRQAPSPHAVWVIEPTLVPRPLLLLEFPAAYGGPRLYRPVSDRRRPDAGALG